MVERIYLTIFHQLQIGMLTLKCYTDLVWTKKLALAHRSKNFQSNWMHRFHVTCIYLAWKTR